MKVPALLKLRSQVDEEMAGRRKGLERQLAALAVVSGTAKELRSRQQGAAEVSGQGRQHLERPRLDGRLAQEGHQGRRQGRGFSDQE